LQFARYNNIFPDDSENTFELLALKELNLDGFPVEGLDILLSNIKMPQLTSLILVLAEDLDLGDYFDESDCPTFDHLRSISVFGPKPEDTRYTFRSGTSISGLDFLLQYAPDLISISFRRLNNGWSDIIEALGNSEVNIQDLIVEDCKIERDELISLLCCGSVATARVAVRDCPKIPLELKSFVEHVRPGFQWESFSSQKHLEMWKLDLENE